MEENSLLKDSKQETTLKQSIGFGTAFKATLGFYLAQALITLIGLGIFGLTILILIWIF